MIKLFKRLFCRHKYKDFVVFENEGGTVYHSLCIKCDEPEGKQFSLNNCKLKEKYNFSIVKGMAEAARLYKKFYNEHFDYLEIDDQYKYLFLENSITRDLYFYNKRDIEIKNNAIKDANFNWNKKIKKEKEIELQRKIKMDECYMYLRRN